MLDFAIKYRNELIKKDREYWNVSDNFKSASSYHDTLVIDENTWNKIQMVSLNADGNVAGYISISRDRYANRYYSLVIQNYDNNILRFGRDVYKFIFDIFNKADFRKLNFAVYTDNPIMKTYDRLVKKYGGRVVGIYVQHDKLSDGYYHDLKGYEILKQDIVDYLIDKEDRQERRKHAKELGYYDGDIDDMLDGWDD